MEMIAIVIQSGSTSLLVRDTNTGGEVRVNFRDARRFSPGDRIRITFSGAMTKSIPPQITATSIQLIPNQPSPPSSPSQIRAVVIQRSRNSLRVRDSSNRQIIVRYRYSYHFCVGQRVVVMYETIFMNNPITVNATDIIPVC